MLKRVLAERGERAILFIWESDRSEFDDDSCINISNLHDPSSLSALRKVIGRTPLKAIYDLNFSMCGSIRQGIVETSHNIIKSVNNIVNCADLIKDTKYIYKSSWSLIDEMLPDSVIDINKIRPKSVLSAGQHYAINLIGGELHKRQINYKIVFGPDYDYEVNGERFYPIEIINEIDKCLQSRSGALVLGDPFENFHIFSFRQLFSCIAHAPDVDGSAHLMPAIVEKLYIKEFVDICFEILGLKLRWEFRGRQYFGFLDIRDEPVVVSESPQCAKLKDKKTELPNQDFHERHAFLRDSIGQLMDVAQP